MKTHDAHFFFAAVKPGDFPAHDQPEVAIMGRSNSGKSSLINALVGRKNLARTSSTPGRTRQIHFYRVDDRMVLVDLPGYGYAQVSHGEQDAWQELVESYLANRTNLRGACLLIDLRRSFQQEEADLVAWLSARQVPVLIALTKADRLKPSERSAAQRRWKAEPGLPATILTSTRTRDGVEELWGWVEQRAPGAS